MQETDFYSGKPVDPPPDNKQQEMEAASMASFGKYDYDPASRAMSQQMMYPGGYGYNTGEFMNPPVGIGSPYRFSPYGNVQPTYGAYQPNPVFNMNPMFQQPQVPTSFHIPGVNMNGEYLPPIDIQNQIDRMQLEYWMKYQEKEAKDSVEQRHSVYGYNTGYGYNYYGVPYYNPYQYNSLNGEIQQKIDEIKTNARQARLEFDQKLSRLAHNICHDRITDDAIRERYEGKTVEIQANTILDPRVVREQTQLGRLVPFDNSQFYRNQFAKVSEEFHRIIPENADLQTTFRDMGIVAAEWELEEEEHRRRNVSTLYQSGDNGYRYFVRKKAEERYAREHGIPMPAEQFDPTAAKQQALQNFPTLSESVKLADDGTLNITCNVGSHAGQTYSVNEKEAGYNERKERFDSFLSSITGSIYRNYNGG